MIEAIMKVINTKSLVTLAAVVLVVPFAAAAGLIGAGVVGGAESAEHNLLLALLAIGGALFGVMKGMERERDGMRGEKKALHITAREREGFHKLSRELTVVETSNRRPARLARAARRQGPEPLKTQTSKGANENVEKILPR